MNETGWRVVLITTVPPVAHALVSFLREAGHEPVAVLSARWAGPGVS